MTGKHLPLEYVNGDLFIDGVSIQNLADTYGTPLYVYSSNSILESIDKYKKGAGKTDHLLCFAMKSNSNRAILELMNGEGLGADIVSGGELFRARKAGIPSNRIVFSGVGKTNEEIEMALNENILLFSVESEEELHNLSKICIKNSTQARISIRVNPDVDARTHPYISTGLKENKFGIMHNEIMSLYRKALSLEGILPVGIGFHIGSQLTSLSAFKDAGKIISKLAHEIRSLGINLDFIDVGGGLGITYDDETPPDPEDYVRELTAAIEVPGATIVFEPGRRIIGNAGILITRILFQKDNGSKRFYICDAGMNDLIRPSLYSAFHEILHSKEHIPANHKADLVGPVCETGDFIARDRELPDFKRDDLAVIASAGAYGFSMSSNYNSRPRAAEVLVDGKVHRLIRKRETYEDLVSKENL